MNVEMLVDNRNKKNLVNIEGKKKLRVMFWMQIVMRRERRLRIE